MVLDAELRDRGAFLDVRSPFTGEVIGEVPRDGPAEAAAAAAAVRPGKGTLAPEERAALLRAAAEALAQRREEFAVGITREAGVCLKESRREVERACGNLLVAAEEATRINGEALPVGTGGSRKLALTVREPVGVVCAITPFNRPLNQVVVKLAPALAAGNAVVLKPSEKAPLSGIAFVQLLLETGLPPGLVAIVTGEPTEVGPALVQSPEVDMVAFTGSVETGEAVARAAAPRKLLLELGGNDPLIVLDDVDLPLAARLAADGALATAGQSCRGVKRIIVCDDVADELVPLLVALAAEKRSGDPLDPETDVGPLIDQAAAELVQRRVEDAVAAGAELLLGGGRKGAFVPPTVLDRVPPDAELVRRETLGPVAPVIRVRDEDEAVAVSNSTVYGLQAGVVTGSFERFLRVAHRLEVGAVNYMESPSFDSPHIPFGGVKRSGLGREGIRYAIEEMTSVKTITVPRPWP
ncbi:MAG: aldehyde dehydrogenase family protein [Actinobacteria bacterium]|nr:MAG: aldehyde dehydrogenase family protein [Actinomycetota bacterium]